MEDEPLLQQPVELPEDQTGTHPPETPSYRPKSNKRKWLIILLVVIALAGVAFGAMSLLGKSSDQTSQNTTATPPPTASPEPEPDLPETSETKFYENGPLGVTLRHPVNWQVKDSTERGIRIESPDFSYQTFNGTDRTGNFRIYIRKGARAQDSKYIGRGVAIKDSEKITYTEPTVGQRSDTLLSSFGLDEPDNFNYFFVAGNFQLKKGDTLGPDYGKEPETYIIAGGFSAADNEEDMDFVSVDPDMLGGSNAHKQAVDIVKSLQLY